jgi:uncharacterized membrane protein
MISLRFRPIITFAVFAAFTVMVNTLVLIIPQFDLLKAILGFIWLFLLPGWMITRIIRLSTPSAWERIAFTVGFSVLAVMATGLAVNTLLPLFHVVHPLAVPNLVFGIDAVWLGLLIAQFLRSRGRLLTLTLPRPNRPGIVAALAGLPMVALAALGAISLNNGGSGLYTYLMLVYAVAYLGILLRRRDKLPESALATGIYLVALSCLLMTSLRGWFTTGHDIQREYKVFMLTLTHLRWDMAYYQDAYNACLSITILPTVVRQILGINEVFVYKTVFQMLFAIVPVLVYLITRRYSTRLIALLASIYFIAFPTYAQDMPMLNRQEVAFLFMGLIFLTMFNDTWSLNRRRLLVAGLGLGVVLSHYSTTYTMLTMFLLVVGLRYGMRLLGSITNRISPRRALTFAHWRRLRPAPLNLMMVIFLLAASYIWSTQLTKTGGNIEHVALETIQAIGKGITGDTKSSDTSYSLFGGQKLTDQQRLQDYINKTVPTQRAQIPKDDLYPTSSYANLPPKIAPPSSLPLTSLGRFLQNLGLPVDKFNAATRSASALFMQLMLATGIVLLFLARPFATRLNSEYRLFQLASIFLLGAIVALPVLSAEYGLLRAFQQILILSGAAIAFATLTLVPAKYRRARILVPSVLALAFFASSTGLITTALGGYGAQLHLANSGKYYDLYYAHSSESMAMKWLSSPQNHSRGYNSIAASTETDRYTFQKVEQFENVDLEGDSIYPGVITRDSYVFTGYTTTTKGEATVYYNGDPLTYIYPFSFLDANKDEIYASQGVRIYK